MLRSFTVPGIAGAITMLLGAGLYLYEEQHTGRLQVVLIPAVVLMAFGAILSFFAARERSLEG
jgi:hypothetical protein